MLVCLARHWGDGPLALSEVAAEEQLPVDYLEQLAAPLRKAGLIVSQRGVRGGYALARPPERIRMGEVVRALEGPIAPMVCVSEGAAEAVCGLESQCSTRLLWLRVGQAIARALDGMTLADLIPTPRDRAPVLYGIGERSSQAATGKGLVGQHG